MTALLLSLTPAVAPVPPPAEVATDPGPASPPLELTRPPDGRPNEPTRVFNLRVPFKDAPIQNRNEISVDLHEGNAWNADVALEYPGYHPPAADSPLVPVSQAPPGVKIYGADGVIESEITRFIHKLNDTDELEAAFNLFHLTRGNELVDYLVSARFIEWAHTNIIHQDNPQQRQQNGLDSMAQIIFHDLNGKTYVISDGQYFLGTFDLGNTKYFPLANTSRTKAMLNIGTFLGIPMNSFNSHLSLGASVDIADAVRIAGGFGFTVTAQVSGQDNRLIQLWNGLDFFDQPFEADYRFLFSFDYELPHEERVAIGCEMQGATGQMASQPLNATAVNPTAVGVQTPYTPDTKIDTTYRAALRGSEFISLFLQVRFGPPRLAPMIDLYAQENWAVFTGTSFGLLFRQGNNLQDWGVGVRLRQPFD